MIFHHSGSKDTYITNKIVNSASRATGANVGYASTIDLFKLYGESTLKGVSGICTIGGVDHLDKTEQECTDLSGTWEPNLTELSRGLIYFDLSQLKSEIEDQVDVLTDSSLKIVLKMYDVQGTQVAPSNFILELCPLTVAFEEGIGDNIVTFSDNFDANWLSPSTDNTWYTGGVDYSDPAKTSIGAAIATQTFTSGLEDLEMDITTFVQAHWTNSSTTPNHGWMLKFTQTYEENGKSYFVKRFSSRHTRNPMLRPKIEASWSSYHEDDHLNFIEGQENKLTLRNYVNGVPTNVSANNTTGVRLRLSWPDLTTNTWSREMRKDTTQVNSTDSVVSQVSIGGIAQAGVYEAKITPNYLQSSESALKESLVASGSLLIQELWDYEDEATGNTKILHSGSITLYDPLAVTNAAPTDYRFSLLDVKSIYESSETPTIRLFVRDRNLANEPVRIPIQLPSKIIHKAYYQIKDTNNSKILVGFSDLLSTPNESTRISRDSEGMYFKFPISVLPRGRTYTIDIGYYDRGIRRTWESNLAFRVK